MVERRCGGIAECYVEPSLARTSLGCEAVFDLARMCEGTWRLQSNSSNWFDG